MTKTKTQALRVVALVVAAASLTACSHAMMMLHGTGARRPDAAEFGIGPRTSAAGRYVATLEPASPLRTRQLLTLRLLVHDSEGEAITDAQIAIDGGMPQHGHGLPTRPRVTENLGDGAYRVDGVRFNMGGWWELKVTISSARGGDTVTFNLNL